MLSSAEASTSRSSKCCLWDLCQVESRQKPTTRIRHRSPRSVNKNGCYRGRRISHSCRLQDGTFGDIFTDVRVDYPDFSSSQLSSTRRIGRRCEAGFQRGSLPEVDLLEQVDASRLECPGKYFHTEWLFVPISYSLYCFSYVVGPVNESRLRGVRLRLGALNRQSTGEHNILCWHTVGTSKRNGEGSE